MKKKIKFLYLLSLFLTGTISIFAQPQKLTKEQLVEKSNALFESGKQKEAIESDQ